jgi:HTH-type transcriptional regulator/antitoxin HigA
MNQPISVIDPQKYGQLLARVRPTVIRTEDENERMLALVAELLKKGNLIPEEEELLSLVGRLIADFEEKFYHLHDAAPHEVLKALMDARGLKQNDIATLLGSKSRASEVINGKRTISKTQARTLAEFFNVSSELFI